MDVFVVLYDSADGDESECYGVFGDKQLAEQKIVAEIAKWGNDYRFTRNRDRWILDGSENMYWIVTTELVRNNEDIKEPDHL